MSNPRSNGEQRGWTAARDGKGNKPDYDLYPDDKKAQAEFKDGFRAGHREHGNGNWSDGSRR